MKIEEIIKSLLLRYPLFGNVIANLKFSISFEPVPALAYTNGKTVYYKTEFFDIFNEDEQKFVIAHEIFHIVLRHFFRNNGKDKDLLNFVEDAIINQLLVRDGLTMPQTGVNVPDALEYSVEELYMQFLPKLNLIKEWMNANTYHMEIVDLDDWLVDQYEEDLNDLMNENNNIRNEMIEDFQKKIRKECFGTCNYI